jgi:hypothetical protein
MGMNMEKLDNGNLIIEINNEIAGLVIPPISTEPKSRTVMQPWPDAALG